MLLVQQAQHPLSPSLMQPYRHIASSYHRRSPSAPAAVIQVQPTKTPGLLSLSKPAVPRPHLSPASVRHPSPRQFKAKPPQAQQGPLPEKRGRGNSAKDKTARNPSKSRAGHGGRARQPSPSPLTSPEQASTNENVSVTVLPKSTPTPAPTANPNANVSAPTTLVNAPSGRLAKRRNRASVPFPSSESALSLAPKSTKRSQTPPARPKPVPVPVKGKMNSLPISRSDPVLPHFPRVPVRRGLADIFPICDDNDDSQERPSTPSPTGRKGVSMTCQQPLLFDSDADEHERGPRTAPISAQAKTARQYFPSPVPSPRSEQHKRAPSVPVDAMFNFSFESDNEFNLSDTSGFFGRGMQRPRFDSSVRSTSTPDRKSSLTFKYASSMFQNSPSPEHLPPPKFSLASIKKEFVGQT